MKVDDKNVCNGGNGVLEPQWHQSIHITPVFIKMQVFIKVIRLKFLNNLYCLKYIFLLQTQYFI